MFTMSEEQQLRCKDSNYSFFDAHMGTQNFELKEVITTTIWVEMTVANSLHST